MNKDVSDIQAQELAKIVRLYCSLNDSKIYILADLITDSDRHKFAKSNVLGYLITNQKDTDVFNFFEVLEVEFDSNSSRINMALLFSLSNFKKKCTKILAKLIFRNRMLGISYSVGAKLLFALSA